MDNADAFVDEVMQLTRLRLLVGEARHGPRLGDYAGKGPLRRWTEAVAVGVAVSLKRRPDRTTPLDDAVLESGVGTADPELAMLQQRYRPAFRAAFAEALSSLSARDRNLLRLSLAQGLGVEALGALHQVHAAWSWSTVARSASTSPLPSRRGARWCASTSRQAGVSPVSLAPTRFALARALRLGHKDPARARELATAARAALAPTPEPRLLRLADLDAFLRAP